MAGNKALWAEVRPSEVAIDDRNGNPIKVGSIVEVIERNDDVRGLYYVVGIEAGGGRGFVLLLCRTRFDKWDIKVPQSRVSLRVYAPIRGKGE